MDTSGRDKEILSIMEAAARRLEFLDYAGVADLPASAWTPPKAPVEAPPAPVVKAPQAQPAPAAPAPVAFAIWRLGALVAFVEGLAAPAGDGPLFSREHGGQFERLAKWMAGELGVEGFSVKEGWSGRYQGADAGAKAVTEQLSKDPPRMVVALGPVAAEAMLGRSDVKALRARVHDIDGMSVVATHSPALMLKDPARKKEAHNDLLMVLERLR